MEVLYLSEAEVERLLTMEMALEAVEAAFRHLAERQAQNHPRQRLQTAGGALLHYMAAADDHLGYLGMKLYTSSPAGVRFLVPLFRSDTGALVALLEADYLGRVRRDKDLTGSSPAGKIYSHQQYKESSWEPPSKRPYHCHLNLPKKRRKSPGPRANP